MAGVTPLVATRVLGVTYLALGVNAVVTLATQWGQVNGGFYFFQCTGFFLGKELLERREKARRTGVFVGGLGLVLTLLFACAAATSNSNDLRFGMARIKLDDAFLRVIAAGGFIVAAAFFSWQVYVLRRPEVKEFFATPAEAPRFWVIFVPAVAILALVNAFPAVLLNHWLAKAKLKHATIVVVDEATGKRLRPSITYMSSRPPGEPFPQSQLRFTYGDSPEMEVIWVDAGPIEIGVSSEGYGSQKMWIENQDGPKPRQIKLTQLKP